MSETDSGKKLMTLTEVSKKAGISMPTAQRYKNMYADRIPSVGEGRSQRYPEEALEVFAQLKEENIGRRGRPRKSAEGGARARKPAAKRGRKKRATAAKPAAADESGLLTLGQVSDLTGISYPTALRYVKAHLKEIPHKGTGRKRRYMPEAVEVFKRLRSESRGGRTPKAASARRPGRPRKVAAGGAKRGPGRPPKAVAAAASDAGLVARIKDLEKSQKALERQIAKLEKELQKPFKIMLQRK